MKYRGTRHPKTGALKVYKVEGENVRELTPDESQKLWNHSPNGFEWNYGGAGPAQLALAILLDYFKERDFTASNHQLFKELCVSRMPHLLWELDATELELFRAAVDNWKEETAYREIREHFRNKWPNDHAGN